MSQQTPVPSETVKEASKVAKGLEGVVAAETSLSHVDGPGSQLYYRGIPIREFGCQPRFTISRLAACYPCRPNCLFARQLISSLGTPRRRAGNTTPLPVGKGLAASLHRPNHRSTLKNAEGSEAFWTQASRAERDRQPQGSPKGKRSDVNPEPAGRALLAERANQTLSPSNRPGRPSAPGFQPTMTRPPQPTLPNPGTKPLAQVGKPRKSIPETDALPSWNTPDTRGHRLQANPWNDATSRWQKCLGKAVRKCKLIVIENSP